MTFWAKLLTVIAFVLGLVFATMAGVLHVKRENLRETIRNVQNDLNAKIKILENKDAAAQATIAGLKTDLDSKSAEATDLANRLETADRERTTFQAEVAKQQDLVKTLSTNLSDQQRAFEATLSRNKELITHNKSLEDINRQRMAELTAEKTHNSNLRKEKADLETLRDDLKVSLATARQTIDLHNEVFAELKRRNIEYGHILDSFLAMPAIMAKVVTVRKDSRVVVLNVGKESGVKKNFTFTVHRGPKFVAKVTVIEVQDDMSVAMIDLDVKGLDVQRGDNAWTRLP